MRFRQRLVSALALCLATPVGHALDLVGFYVGAAVGQAQLRADAGSFSSQDFKDQHSAYKIVAGVRPIPPLALELAYFDLGRPGGSLNGLPAGLSARGTAAFALLYLPLPVPFLDLYGKAGVARVQSTLDGQTVLPGCTTGCVSQGAFQFDRRGTAFAAGLGAQIKVGSVALRAEYERFGAATASPDLLSLGVSWTIF
jgi:opacity protein-like surface antigen